MSAGAGERNGGGGHATVEVAADALVVDGDANVRSGLEALLRTVGVAVTAVGDHDRARDQLANRFFAVLLVELDGPAPHAGLDLVRDTRARSPQTAVIVLSPRRTFDDVASAFRAGALDVVPKTQDHLPYLRDRVLEAVRTLKASRSRERLLAEVVEVHDRFLTNMMVLSRQVTELEERIAAMNAEAPAEGAAGAPAPGPSQLLIVDDDPALAKLLGRTLAEGSDWVVRTAESGGAALDVASQHPPHVMVVKDTLPDLPASMLITSLKGSLPDLVALVYCTPREGRAGEVRFHDTSRVTTIVPSFVNPAQLLAALEDVREGLQQKARERRHLSAFRKQHAEFLKLYGGLKQRLLSGG